jgi:hypothetical protein
VGHAWRIPLSVSLLDPSNNSASDRFEEPTVKSGDLYIRNGLVDVLEGHTYNGQDWPKREEEIELFSDFFTRKGQ